MDLTALIQGLDGLKVRIQAVSDLMAIRSDAAATLGVFVFDSSSGRTARLSGKMAENALADVFAALDNELAEIGRDADGLRAALDAVV